MGKPQSVGEAHLVRGPMPHDPLWIASSPPDNMVSELVRSNIERSVKVFVTVDPEIKQLPSDIRALREEVAALRALVEQMAGPVARDSAGLHEAAVPKQMDAVTSKETAKAAIMELFEQGSVFSYSDILDKLEIDLELVVEVCEDLIREGKIGERRPAA